MAMSTTLVTQGRNFVVFTATATADADNAETLFTHNLPAAPDLVVLEPLLGTSWALSQWSITTKSATQIGLTKNGVGVGSGNANPQIRGIAVLLHSIQR